MSGAPESLLVVVAVEQLRRRAAGGIGTYAEGLLCGLGALPVESRPAVRLLASRKRGGGVDPLIRFGFPVTPSRLPGPLLVRGWDAGIVRGPRAAVTHAVSTAAPRGRGELVVTVHDLAWRRHPGSHPRRGRRWHEAALHRALERATAFVVPSPEVAADLAAAAPGLHADQVVVIEEGSDHLPEPDRDATLQLLGRLGPQLGGTTVPLVRAGSIGGYLLAVGTLEPRKNLPRLLVAYERARASFPEPWPLLVVGPPGWGAALRHVPDGVLLTGAVPPAVLAGLYAHARCLAYVPLSEGFGLPVVEAMRAGTPVVSSSVPSARGASLLVDPEDVDAIAAGLTAAATDPTLRAQLVAGGTTRVAGATWARTAAAHVDLWTAVAGRSGRG